MGVQVVEQAEHHGVWLQGLVMMNLEQGQSPDTTDDGDGGPPAPP